MNNFNKFMFRLFMNNPVFIEHSAKINWAAETQFYSEVTSNLPNICRGKTYPANAAEMSGLSSALTQKRSRHFIVRFPEPEPFSFSVKHSSEINS